MLLQKSGFQLLLQDIDISRGSVATHLKCVEIFSDSNITNFLQILAVTIFENLSVFDEVVRKNWHKNVQILGHPVYDTIMIDNRRRENMEIKFLCESPSKSWFSNGIHSELAAEGALTSFNVCEAYRNFSGQVR